MEEKINVICRDDGRVRIVYWNKAAGEVSMIMSRKAAYKIQKELRKRLDDPRPHMKG